MADLVVVVRVEPEAQEQHAECRDDDVEVAEQPVAPDRPLQSVVDGTGPDAPLEAGDAAPLGPAFFDDALDVLSVALVRALRLGEREVSQVVLDALYLIQKRKLRVND